jgi:hypothetical protein
LRFNQHSLEYLARNLSVNPVATLKRRKAFLVGAGLILILIIIFFYKFIFLGRIPINGDWWLANFYPGRAYYPLLEAQNPELDDPIYQHLPLRMLTISLWKNRQIPLWNPYIFCGTPLLADGISLPFDPLIWTYLFFGPLFGRGLTFFLQFLLAGLGMYLFLLRLGLRPYAAILGAATFMFNAVFTSWMELRTLVGAMCWLPWVLYFLEGALKRKSIAQAAFASLFLGFSILGGHLQYAFYGFVVAFLYGLYRTGRYFWGEKIRKDLAVRLGLVGLTLLLGSALGAVQILPQMELARQSQRSPYQYRDINFLSPLSLFTFLMPEFFGNPVEGDYVRVLGRSFLALPRGYIGAFAAILALLGALGPQRKRAFFFTLLGAGTIVFLILLGAGLGLFMVKIFPDFHALDVTRLVIVYIFSASVLAGFGMEGVISSGSKGGIFSLLKLSLLILTLLFLCLLFSPYLEGYLSSVGEEGPRLFRYFLRLKARYGLVPLAPQIILPLGLATLGILLTIIYLNRRVRLNLYKALIFILLAGELLYFGWRYSPYVPRDLIYPPMPVLETLKLKPTERILGKDPPGAHPAKGDMLIPNSALAYGLADVRGDESFYPKRYLRFMRLITGEEVSLLACIHLPEHNSLLLDLLGVKYILTAEKLNNRKFSLIYEEKKTPMKIYENKGTFPRAFVVRDWKVVGDERALVSELGSGRFRPYRLALLEEPAPFSPPRPSSPQEDEIEITRYEASAVDIAARLSTPGLVILTDSYFPGWRAYVDGEEKKIYQVDYILRGVFLNPGKHQVRFIYKPRYFVMGAAVSGISLFIIVIIWLGCLKRLNSPASLADN